MDAATVTSWSLVLEVDRTWFALKGALADRPCPERAGVDVALGEGRALVGRTSASRGVHPDVAIDDDTGVSRRHAQFVVEADQLTVVDLSSTNGTFVVAAGEVPSATSEALVPGVPVVLHDGDRVYLGAWTRLTVRQL